MSALLKIRDLRVGFGRGRSEALHGIDLTIDEGVRVGLIGESGSGKSVTALATMGLLPDNAQVSGSIELGGRQLVGLSDNGFAQLRGDVVSMIFQEPMTALDPTMRVGRQVAEVLRLHQGAPAGKARERVIEMLGRVGLAEPERIAMSFPHQLSGGQRQRALIAMALINQPELVICDEPTTALDVTVQARVLRLLDEQLDAAGAACLFISHDLAVVSQVCDEVLVMYRGDIVESGPIAQVLEQPRHPYTAGLVATARIDQIEPGRRLPVIEDFWDRKEGCPQ
ncbi:ABC transporter ATP-binding protein [Propionibacterium australiense]|uniref:ABC transporter n=1 Tax=Propionibacterium australiense TaxID=119981 RepID=A0A383S553_9ACTN|nr:ABC transporter ATP-binding protein [Propionibacterium australiense]RLP11672.1 ATP-binding cassette domain-containing protein [Propionibacterium australiense]RLP12185.1 ATP-binding cassette domain-containing protein [Propionibacterium australiense]SYZ32406.1 ABC transporter [Propionibacterium australiense]VEH90278.1 Glutathione import ATP-binding protein GsiA [Propionibacterium australiense]